MAFSDTLCAEARPIWEAILREAFLTSSRYEHAFWDTTYRTGGWPV